MDASPAVCYLAGVCRRNRRPRVDKQTIRHTSGSGRITAERAAHDRTFAFMAIRSAPEGARRSACGEQVPLINLKDIVNESSLRVRGTGAR